MPRRPRCAAPHIPAAHSTGKFTAAGPPLRPERTTRVTPIACGEAVFEHDCELHAYALLPDRVYLLCTPEESNEISRLIQTIGRRFVPGYNSRYQRTGPLWYGRYRSAIVEPSGFVVSAYRFIEDAPLLAQATDDANKYAWSSRRANIGQVSSSLLRPHRMFQQLGQGDAKRAKREYASLCDRPLNDKLRQELEASVHHCLVLGTERYKDEVERCHGIRARLGKRGRPKAA